MEWIYAVNSQNVKISRSKYFGNWKNKNVGIALAVPIGIIVNRGFVWSFNCRYEWSIARVNYEQAQMYCFAWNGLQLCNSTQSPKKCGLIVASMRIPLKTFRFFSMNSHRRKFSPNQNCCEKHMKKLWTSKRCVIYSREAVKPKKDWP